MKIKIFDFNNNVTGELDCSDSVFNVENRPDVVARVVNWQLAKRRSGSHNVKSKSEVHGTTKKFVRQKGSGGARHGSKKAAQFRGGGIIFGPVNREHGYSLPKKIRKLGLKIVLSNKVQTGNLIVFDTFNSQLTKTKEFVNRFGDLGTALFVDVDKNDMFEKLLRNVSGFDFIPQIGANVYDIIHKEKLILSSGAVKALESRLI